MAIPLDKCGTKTNNQPSKSKYRLDDSERKLPRPIVFWSDNEKDAFRRNKVVQTRYHMLLNDIEIQQKSSQKTIRHEAHKFRRRYKAEIQSASDVGSSADISYMTVPTASTPIDTEHKETDSTNSSSDSDSDHSETWAKVPRKGVITKIKKSNVKFSDSTDAKCDEQTNVIDQVKFSTDISMQRKNLKIRSQSAVQSRTNTHVQPSNSKKSNRSKSALTKLPGFSFQEHENSNHNLNTEDSNKETPSRKPNSIFFDRSQAAYQLRKELQKLAKVRKHGVVKVAFTMEDAIREERDKLQASSKKVAEYIQRLEIDQRNMKINEWTSKTIEPVVS